jgi:hypothetical protein
MSNVKTVEDRGGSMNTGTLKKLYEVNVEVEYEDEVMIGGNTEYLSYTIETSFDVEADSEDKAKSLVDDMICDESTWGIDTNGITFKSVHEIVAKPSVSG